MASTNIDANSVFLNVISILQNAGVARQRTPCSGRPHRMRFRPSYMGARPKKQLLCHSVSAVFAMDLGANSAVMLARSGCLRPEIQCFELDRSNALNHRSKLGLNRSLCRLVYKVGRRPDRKSVV